MSERTVWTCDGCADELVVSENVKRDWHRITVEMNGFIGYPVGDRGNETHTYELCPHCQKMLFERANPRSWPRSQASGASS